MEIVKTEAGLISGFTQGEPGRAVYVFRGVPYAAPPLGDLRWKAPQPPIPWPGVRACTGFSAQAPQGPKYPSPSGTSEDCLYLNILTPDLKPNAKLPVMVWMHGCGFAEGSGNWEMYNALGLPQHGVVLVNENMRLQVIGLMAHSLLSQESPHKVSGNYLLLDMMQALKWVKNNITAFGGDPHNVTIFGESGGGNKVVSLMASPLAKGLFHHAIIESGAQSIGYPLKDLEANGEKLFAAMGVDKAKDPLAAARSIPWEDVLEIDRKLTNSGGLTLNPGMIPHDGDLWDVAVDGWCLTGKPHDIFAAGKQNRVPFIIGANLGETKTIRFTIPNYVHLLSGVGKAGVKAYAYIFDQVPAGWRQQGCRAFHAIELPYVFGTWNDLVPWEHLAENAVMSGLTGAKASELGCSEADGRISELVMSMWTQFARTGCPDIKGLVTWPEYDTINKQYLYIREPLEVRNNLAAVNQ
jgi:para-nitrobenzyl esterase